MNLVPLWKSWMTSEHGLAATVLSQAVAKFGCLTSCFSWSVIGMYWYVWATPLLLVPSFIVVGGTNGWNFAAYFSMLWIVWKRPKAETVGRDARVLSSRSGSPRNLTASWAADVTKCNKWSVRNTVVRWVSTCSARHETKNCPTRFRASEAVSGRPRWPSSLLETFNSVEGRSGSNRSERDWVVWFTSLSRCWWFIRKCRDQLLTLPYFLLQNGQCARKNGSPECFSRCLRYDARLHASNLQIEQRYLADGSWAKGILFS